ncbi:hypothetical protein JTB14_006038 [Gonioctena quinquepunctata]|nr:hypothetical protein JTB14_006038 [Gonioctena quinquepunctata]
MAVVVATGSKLLKQQPGIISIAYVRSNNYSTDDRAYNLASLKRGTGGRSSFNGLVATVFGATGFMGRYVCNRLGKIGTQLIIPYRGDNYEPFRLKLVGDLGQVYFHPYHLRDEESILKCMKYSNVVINLVGRDWETRNFKFDDVHVDGARRLARAAKQSGVERFIHLSALNASENPGTAGILKGGSKFLASKARGEEAVLEEFPEATIFRPADVYGQEDRFVRYYAHKKLSVNWPIGNLHWEKIEREHLSDDVKSDIPTLEDLGVNLTTVEQQIPWELKPWTYGIYRGQDPDEPQAPAAPPSAVI